MHQPARLKAILLGLLCGSLSACANYSGRVSEVNLNTTAPAETTAATPIAATPATTVSKLSLVVPLQGNFSKAGQAVRNGYLNAYYQAKVGDTVDLAIVNSQASANALSVYQQAVSSHQPNLMVGPLTKADVSALAKEALLSTPVLALNRADVANTVPSNFYQFSLDPQAEARLVAERLQHDGYRRVYVVAPSGDWGQSIAASFGKAWLVLGGAISDSASYQADENFTPQAQTLLGNVGNTDHVAIFLVATAADARMLVPILRNQAANLPIYALPVVYSGVPNTAANTVLNGIIFPSSAWQLDSQSEARQAFTNLYPDADEDALRLYGFGMDAFALSQYYLAKHSFQGLNLDGFSGRLSLGENGVIERQLLWATFVNGNSQRLGN